MDLGVLETDCAWVDALSVGTEALIPQPDSYTETSYAEVLDCDLKFTSMGDNDALWYACLGPSDEFYLDGDSAQSDSPSDANDSCLQTIVESDSAETIKF